MSRRRRKRRKLARQEDSQSSSADVGPESDEIDPANLEKFRVELLNLILVRKRERQFVPAGGLGPKACDWSPVVVDPGVPVDLHIVREGVDYVLVYIGSRKHPVNLRHGLNSLKVRPVRNLYQTYCAPPDGAKKLDKGGLVIALQEFFVSGQLPSKRRKEEAMALENVDTENLFFPLNIGWEKTVVLPKPLLVNILSFMKYDGRIVTSCGLVAWDWFVLVLSTWPSVAVKKANVLLIPILVLKSVREVVFCGQRRDALSAAEVKYVLKNINFGKVVSLQFVSLSESDYLRRVLRAFKRMKNVPRAVTTVSFRHCQRCDPCYRVSKSVVDLADISPRITQVIRVPILRWCSSLKQMTRVSCSRLEQSNQGNLSPDLFRSLRSLELTIPGYSPVEWKGVYPAFLSGILPQLETLRLSCVHDSLGMSFPDAVAAMKGVFLPKLRELCIVGSGDHRHPIPTFEDVQIPNCTRLLIRGYNHFPAILEFACSLPFLQVLILWAQPMLQWTLDQRSKDAIVSILNRVRSMRFCELVLQKGHHRSNQSFQWSRNSKEMLIFDRLVEVDLSFVSAVVESFSELPAQCDRLLVILQPDSDSKRSAITKMIEEQGGTVTISCCLLQERREKYRRGVVGFGLELRTAEPEDLEEYHQGLLLEIGSWEDLDNRPLFFPKSLN